MKREAYLFKFIKFLGGHLRPPKLDEAAYEYMLFTRAFSGLRVKYLSAESNKHSKDAIYLCEILVNQFLCKVT